MGTAVVVLLVVGVILLLFRATRTNREPGAAPTEPKPRLKVEVTVSTPGETTVSDLHLDEIEDRVSNDERYGHSRELEEISGEFFADVRASANGVFLVGARSGAGIPPNREDGLLVLANRQTGKVMFRTDMPRPHSPSASDDGRVVVEDWGSSDVLAGSLVCFEPDGRQAWSFDLRANVHPSGISASGRRAFVSTARSDYEPHSNRIFVLDAVTGEFLWDHNNWRLRLEPRFDGDDLLVSVRMPDGSMRDFKFDEHGELGADFEEGRDAIEIGIFGVAALAPKVQAALSASPPRLDEAERLIKFLDVDRLLAESSRAKYLRVRGEVSEARGDVAAAVAAYRKALELDPKVGVKRRLAALEKTLA